MQMPWFTAERSLDKTRRHYRGTGQVGVARYGAIIPQAPRLVDIFGVDGWVCFDYEDDETGEEFWICTQL
jgi:hypothetical protein